MKLFDGLILVTLPHITLCHPFFSHLPEKSPGRHVSYWPLNVPLVKRETSGMIIYRGTQLDYKLLRKILNVFKYLTTYKAYFSSDKSWICVVLPSKSPVAKQLHILPKSLLLIWCIYSRKTVNCQKLL